MMGMTGVAICVPPIGMGIASMLLKKKFTPEEQEAGKAAAAMGLIGITEGAIPFAASDPFVYYLLLWLVLQLVQLMLKLLQKQLY